MSETFKEYFEKQNVIQEPQILPITHIFNIKYVYKFFIERNISKEYLGPCDVFKEFLLYFFYGRPAFKLNDLNAYPACFVFKSDLENTVKIFPFDSGAYHGQRMYKYFADTDIEDFNIQHRENVHKIVDYFYPQKAMGYYDILPGNMIADPVNYSVTGYHEMIVDKTDGSMDERRSSIELIFNESIGLENLILAVIPSNNGYDFGGPFWESNDVKKELIEQIGCEVIQYNYVASPSKNYKEIYKIVRNHIEKCINKN